MSCAQPTAKSQRARGALNVANLGQHGLGPVGPLGGQLTRGHSHECCTSIGGGANSYEGQAERPEPVRDEPRSRELA
jgi:hypothetical protein